MKIAILSVRDTGGTGYNLAHAINKITPENQCVNMTVQGSYINYPMLVDMGNYSANLCKKMVYASDVIVFLGYMKPFYEGLHLNKRKLKDKKKLLLCMGSEWRYGRKELIKEADELLGNYQILLGGSGMFLPYPEGESVPDTAKFLPPTRSFTEIQEKHGLCNQDEAAVVSFGIEKEKVVFCHAPTSDMKKGTASFYRAITRVHQILPYTSLLTIRNQPWVSCLTSLARADVLLDQDPPFPVGYGAITIEASIFKLPIVTKVDPSCIAWLKKETGLDVPFVSFKDEEELFEKIYVLARDPKLRSQLGDLAYNFCKALHDEKPVVDRFFKIIGEMD